MSNGIKLMGVSENNPLVRSGEVYKLRYVRPDKPIGHSEIWEDSTTIRLTIFGKLVSDELMLTFCRFESAGYIPGTQDDDAVGINAVKGVLDLHDAGNLTVKPFLHRKISGNRDKYANSKIMGCYRAYHDDLGDLGGKTNQASIITRTQRRLLYTHGRELCPN